MLKLKNHFWLVLFVYIHLLTHMLLFSSHLAMLAIIYIIFIYKLHSFNFKAVNAGLSIIEGGRRGSDPDFP